MAKGARQNLDEMPQMAVETEPGSNGHEEVPGGNSQLFGVDNMGQQGFGESPSRHFMTAHAHDMGRLLAESIITEDEREQLIMQEFLNQDRLGFVDMTSILRLKFAASIGIKGRGREDGVKVETMSFRGLMGRTRGWMGRMFGMGGGGTGGMPTNPPTMSGGY